jgi:hypothetical protein
MAAALSAFGVPATVTRPAPDNTPLATTGIWLSPVLIDVPPGSDLQRREMRRVFSVTRAVVPTLPRGTRIDAAERSGDVVQAWRVDEPAGADADHLRAIVIPW